MLNPYEYKVACKKFMEREGCSYEVAQANIDRLNDDAVAWALERTQADRALGKADYLTPDRQPIFKNLYELVTGGNSYVAYDEKFPAKAPPTKDKYGELYYRLEDIYKKSSN